MRREESLGAKTKTERLTGRQVEVVVGVYRVNYFDGRSRNPIVERKTVFGGVLDSLRRPET